MNREAFVKMTALARRPEELEQTAAYLSEHLRQFLKIGDTVLICFPNREPDAISGLTEKAVRQAGGIPLFWGPDFRWKALLRLAFSHKPTVIIGPPLVLLGLTKLTRAAGTPLYVRHVVTAGYPCMDWMIDGIIRGLDCKTWGIFGPGTGALVSGFSCSKSLGVHLRDDIYGVEIVDKDGKPLPEGQVGEVILYRKDTPTLRYHTLEQARIESAPCPCGCGSPRLMDFSAGENVDKDLQELADMLQSWMSILDCRVSKGPHGLELELITFPGEKLPKLPTCAKRVVRPWDPDKDEPFWYAPRPSNSVNCGENH